MNDALLSMGLIGLFAIASVACMMLFADGAYQVVSGRPSFLRVEQLVRKRKPASPMDCVAQGASKAFQATGMAVASGPSIAMSWLSLNALARSPLPPLASLPRPFFDAAMVVWLVLFGLGIGCMGISFALALRVKYVRLDGSAMNSHVERI